jgi:hypothetical protein|tara:strand:+ start:149 stop:298 length:150 start_codon:yes stop_codon:yes gene_type:complete
MVGFFSKKKVLRQLCGSRSRRAGCLEAGWIYGNAGNALLRLDSAGGVAD